MSNLNKKISVIVTVLNEEKTIVSLLGALQNQQPSPAEIIIVDGGSTDKTMGILNTFKDSNLRIFKQKGNRSVGRNAAIRTAQHELVAITDAGCIPHSDWLLELSKAYQENSVVAGYYDSQAQTHFQEAVVPYALVMPEKVNPKNFLPATRSMLLPKPVWEQLRGFNELLSDNEDYEFAHRIKDAQIPIIFTTAAKVTWIPPSNFYQFLKMIFRFARGDAFAGIWRPKVLLLFTRYFVGLGILVALFQFGNLRNLIEVFMISLLIYSSWAIQKNLRYVPRGWYWLPILQLGADLAVMVGSIQGVVLSLFRSLDQHTLRPDRQK